MEYAVLLSPGHNRVYYGAARQMAAAELAVLAAGAGLEAEGIALRALAGADFLCFTTAAPLAGAALRAVSRASFAQALFEKGHAGGRPALFPLEPDRGGYLDDGISAMLKYRGKTNELFTRMMINLAQYSSAFAAAGRLRLLDPLAGKGTTLFEAASLGFDAYGVELAAGVANEAGHFFRRWLENARMKHSQKEDRIGAQSGRAARRHFEYAATPAAFKAGDTRVLEVIAGNSLDAGSFYKKGFFELIVCDLPYGVQHGNVSAQGQTSLTRSPAQLLEKCLPVWKTLHKKGGAIAAGWNTLVLGRAQAAALFEKAGYTVLEGGPYAAFGHRVEQAVNRDVIVAVNR